MPKQLDDATVSALIAKHGDKLETVELSYLDEPVVLRPPTEAEWRVFRDTEHGTVDGRLEFLVDTCIVYPDRSVVQAAAKERPALTMVLGNVVTELAGFQGDVKRKKLQRPSATPK